MVAAVPRSVKRGRLDGSAEGAEFEDEMTARPSEPPTLDVRPLVPERWDDFEALFGPKGAYGGCWCMWWRETRSEFQRRGNDGNRAAMRAIVDSGEVPGLLGYLDGRPVGWVSVAPRESYPSVERSRVLKRLDDEPVWSIVCLYVARGHRGEGIARSLVEAAVEHVAARGGKIVEAYPTAPRGRKRLAPVSSFMGVPSLFEAAGFVERARPSKSRVVMRRTLE